MKSDKLLRLIVPVFPRINVFSGASSSTTDFGSASLATKASEVAGWKVEIIQENNYKGPRNKDGLPDHIALQQERWADLVGFCCGLTCSVERVWKLAELYKFWNIPTIAGGWHAHYCPKETLSHNIDLVVHGDGELELSKILQNVSASLSLYEGVEGCSFVSNGQIYHKNPSAEGIFQISDAYSDLAAIRNEVKNLDELRLNHGFLRHFNKIRYFTMGRSRGCPWNCEFCSVKGGVHFASGNHAFEVLDWLVQKMGARRIFVVDDLFEENLSGTMELLRLVKKKYGRKLIIMVQVRLQSAANTEFVQAMYDAGVRILCVGYESPHDGDLKAMRKGITSTNMLEWTRIYGSKFWVHAMTMFGYPPKDGQPHTTAQELEDCFRNFIQKALPLCPYGLTIQILKPIPAVGTDLRRRLEDDGQVFPLEVLPWRYYDGNWACHMPKNMSLQELQETPIEIMDWFYGQFTPLRILVGMLRWPINALAYGWNDAMRRLHKEFVGFAASHMMQKWHRQTDSERRELTAILQSYWNNRR